MSTLSNRVKAGRALLIVTCFATVAAVTVPAHTQDPSVVGLWQKLDGGEKPAGWFLFVERNGLYEGAIARLFLRAAESQKAVCSKCVDDRKNAPLVGISFVRGMKRSGLKYEDGTILDPRDGRVYNAVMTLSPDGNTLTLRGYLGIPAFGMDQVWHRLPDSALKEIDRSVLAKYLPDRLPGWKK